MGYPMVKIKDENEEKQQIIFRTWCRKGKILANNGKYSEAINCYNRALQIRPDHADMWYEKGLALYHMNQYDDALKSFSDSLRINSKDSDAWYAMGTTFFLI